MTAAIANPAPAIYAATLSEYRNIAGVLEIHDEYGADFIARICERFVNNANATGIRECISLADYLIGWLRDLWRTRADLFRATAHWRM